MTFTPQSVDVDTLKAQLAHIQANYELQQRYLDIYQKTSLQLLQPHSLDELLTIILQRAAELADTPDGFLYMLDTSDQALHARAGIGIFEPMVGWVVRQNDTGLVNQVWQTGETHIVYDYYNWVGRVRTVSREGRNFHSCAAVPLKAYERVIGVISLVHQDKQRVFNDQTMHILTNFATLAAFAIENHFLRDRLETERHFSQTVADTLPGIVTVFDFDLRRNVYVNTFMERIYGVKLEETKDGTFGDYVHPDDHKITKRYFDEELVNLADGVVASTEFRIRGADGDWHWLQMHDVVLERRLDGTVKQTLGIGIDITERKQAEADLHTSEALFRAIFENAGVGIVLVKASPATQAMRGESAITQANPRYQQMTGYSEPELQTMNYKHLTHPDDIPQEQRYIEETVKGERNHYSIRKRYIRKDGTIIWVRLTASIFSDGIDTYAVIIAEDISDTVESETNLLRYKAAVQSSGDMIAVVDQNYHYLLVNDAYRRFRVLNKQQIVGEPVARVLGEDTFEYFIKPMLDRCFNGETIRYEMKEGHPEENERDLLVVYTPLRDDQDQIGGAVITIRDVTESKRSEKRAIQIEIEQQRSKFLSEIVQNTSHEFRTPLSTMNTSLYMLERLRDNEERHQHHLETVHNQVARLSNLIDGMLTMAQLDALDSLPLKRINLQEQFISLQDEIRYHVERTRQRVNFAPLVEKPVSIMADMMHLHRAIMNIVQNAQIYSDEGTLIHCALEIEGNHAVIRIQDHGIGISETVMPHIFDRFYRADEARTLSGIGLGLSIARSIIQHHNGYIVAESIVGEGSTFRIYLPLV